MYTILYTSKEKCELGFKEIESMLLTARVFNHANGITGCLIHHKGSFIQLIEGEKDVVQNLYDKIKKDKRHYQIRELFSGLSIERLFKNWYMVDDDIYSSYKFSITKKELFKKVTDSTNLIPNYSGSPLYILWQYSQILFKEDCSVSRTLP